MSTRWDATKGDTTFQNCAIRTQLAWYSGGSAWSHDEMGSPRGIKFGKATHCQDLEWFSPSPDSKVHGANMGFIWGRQDPAGLHVGPMNRAGVWAYLWGVYDRMPVVSYHKHLNPSHAKLFRGNIIIYLHFMSLPHIELTPVAEILPRVRQGSTYSRQSISWLLMTWQRKELRGQRTWYLLCWTGLKQSLR